MHGWGANAEDLADLAPFLNLPDYHFFFPNAPFPHPYSSVGRAWYDFQRNEGIEESRQLLRDWLSGLESETGIPLSRTILSGFSQGGAMTLDVGLNLPLAGLVSLSGYLHPITQGTQPDVFPPTLIVHGTRDSIVPVTAGQNARDVLTSLGVAVQYEEFNMAHEVIPAVIQLMRSFVLQIMSVETPKA